MSASSSQPTDDSATCPWCSAQVPAEASRCPSCNAALRDGADGDVLGVTQVDLAKASRLARLKPPGRIAMWLGAEKSIDSAELAGRIEPPSDEVKAEMLRMELAAIDAEIEAKNAQLEAERMLSPEGDPASEPDPEPTSGADEPTASELLAPDVAPEEAPKAAPDDSPGAQDRAEPG